MNIIIQIQKNELTVEESIALLQQGLSLNKRDARYFLRLHDRIENWHNTKEELEKELEEKFIQPLLKSENVVQIETLCAFLPKYYFTKDEVKERLLFLRKQSQPNRTYIPSYVERLQLGEEGFEHLCSISKQIDKLWILIEKEDATFKKKFAEPLLLTKDIQKLEFLIEHMHGYTMSRFDLRFHVHDWKSKIS